tara:strand:- start:596 stop:1156 length:561 start_codon:yes stop_codon:yes gene_type:complete
MRVDRAMTVVIVTIYFCMVVAIVSFIVTVVMTILISVVIMTVVMTILISVVIMTISVAVLVIFFIVMIVVTAFDLQNIKSPGGDQKCSLGARRLDQTIEPAFKAQSVDDQEIGRGKSLNIRRAGYENMRVLTDTDQRDHMNPVTTDLGDHVAENAEARDNVDGVLVGRRPMPLKKGGQTRGCGERA